MSDPYRNLKALRHKIAEHGARVAASHPRAFACAQGCDGCCQTERSAVDVEFGALADAFAQLPQATRDRIAAQADAEHCSLLLDGSCALYEQRPLICRSHGLPILMEHRLDVCPLNFKGKDLGKLPLEEVLNVDSVTAVLVAVNALYCQEEGGDPQRRREMRELLNA